MTLKKPSDTLSHTHTSSRSVKSAHRCILVHQVGSMTFLYGLLVLLASLLFFLYLSDKKDMENWWKRCLKSRGCIWPILNDSHLSNYVFSIDKGFKSTHCCRLLQWKDILCFNGNSTLVCIGLENDDLVEVDRKLGLRFKIIIQWSTCLDVGFQVFWFGAYLSFI